MKTFTRAVVLAAAFVAAATLAVAEKPTMGATRAGTSEGGAGRTRAAGGQWCAPLPRTTPPRPGQCAPHVCHLKQEKALGAACECHQCGGPVSGRVTDHG